MQKPRNIEVDHKEVKSRPKCESKQLKLTDKYKGDDVNPDLIMRVIVKYNVFINLACKNQILSGTRCTRTARIKILARR